MRLTIESTDRVVNIQCGAESIPARVWQTDDGILLFVPVLALPNDGRDSATFDAELRELANVILSAPDD